jgi:hypothetical protein
MTRRDPVVSAPGKEVQGYDTSTKEREVFLDHPQHHDALANHDASKKSRKSSSATFSSDPTKAKEQPTSKHLHRRTVSTKKQ